MTTPAALKSFDPERIAEEAWHDAWACWPDVRTLTRAAASAPGRLGEAAAHHLQDMGKGLRASLAMAVGQALGLLRAEAMPIAVAVELLHNASLVHDDLQDQDPKRRGLPAVWVKFGEAHAVSLGVHLLSRCQAELAAAPWPPPTRLRVLMQLNAATDRLLTGQTRDLEAHTDPITAACGYEETARQKTGTLIALPFLIALDVAGHNGIADAQRCFDAIGLAYQIQDDVADLLGQSGREHPAQDLRRGTVNAPLANFLVNASDDARQALAEFLTQRAGAQDEEALVHWCRRLVDSGAVAKSLDRAQESLAEGAALAESLPPVVAALVRLSLVPLLKTRIDALAVAARREARAEPAPP